MRVKSRKNETEEQTRAMYATALASAGRPTIDVYGSGLGDFEGLGDPLSDFVGQVKGKLGDLDLGLKIAAAASVAAAIGVILLLATMPRR